MCITLTIDDDLALALKTSAHNDGATFETAANAAIRRGLSEENKFSVTRGRFRVVSAPRGFLPEIDPLKLNQLSDKLELDGGSTHRTRELPTPHGERERRESSEWSVK